MNPGMMLRVDEYSVDAMKQVFEKYLPNYVESSIDMPKNFTYEYNTWVPGMSFAIDWEDISYTDFDLHMEEVSFELTREINQFGAINMKFPAIHHLTIQAI